MSSEIEGVAALGALLLVPPIAAAGAALGAGWVAWQAGKLAIGAAYGAAEAANDQIRYNQRRHEEAEKQKRLAAVAAHDQMVAMCQSVLAQLRADKDTDPGELRQLTAELEQLCKTALPGQTAGIEQLNARGLMVLERITDRHTHLRNMTLRGKVSYGGKALGDLMKDLRLAVATVKVSETRGTNVSAPDPDALERAALQQRLADVSARILEALDFIVALDRDYGLSTANSAWFNSCFAGVDETIATLCAPATTNAALKRGIRDLEENMEIYDGFCPTLRKEQAAMDALYAVYAEAARNLCEKPHSLRHFRSSDALQAELRRLEGKAKRAAECAALYQALGAEGYLCYAWDQELTALGYSVCSRKKITRMVTQAPDRAQVNGETIPFYRWRDGALTQLYEVSPQCRLQLIVHPDGTTTMETISVPGDEAAVTAAQKTHCQQMKVIQQRLRENWFILHEMEETSSPDTIHGLAAWQDPMKNPWVRLEEIPGMEARAAGQAAAPQKELHMEQ